MIFDWDPNKREQTIRERDIDFLDAALIWDDPMRQERIDLRGNYDEDRYQTIGRVQYGILFVVYTERVNIDGKEVVHIISARKANKRDRREYETRTFHLRRIE